MAAPTVNVSVHVEDSESVPIESATIHFSLNRVDVDDGLGYIVPNSVTGTTDVNGDAVIAVWPNALGATESSYEVTIIAPNNRTITSVRATIPNSNVNLIDVADLPVYPGKSDGELNVTAVNNAVGYATEWASKAEDSLVTIAAGGDGATDYSALHWGAKTAADAVATAADLVATNQDTIDTAADVVTTNADVVLTNADVVSVAAIYDSFDDRYLGPKASPPSVDNDGGALLVGAAYWSTAANKMYVWNGAAWSQLVDSLHNTTAIIAPTINDDAGDSYSVGSLWVDTVLNEAYRCLDATIGAAVWANTTLDIAELGSIATQDSNAVSITGGAISGLTSLGVSGNITVTGTVDGRDIAADGTKLNTIETSATADQTAAEILTALLTVDIDASGLNANTLQGNLASAFQAAGSYEPSFSKNTAFNKNFGTATNTLIHGNDARLSDARTPVAHNQSAATITTGTLPVLRGGTGVTTKTGTGNVVLSTSPTIGNATVGTQTAGNNTTLAASTAFVTTAVAAVSAPAGTWVEIDSEVLTTSTTAINIDGMDDTLYYRYKIVTWGFARNGSSGTLYIQRKIAGVEQGQVTIGAISTTLSPDTYMTEFINSTDIDNKGGLTIDLGTSVTGGSPYTLKNQTSTFSGFRLYTNGNGPFKNGGYIQLLGLKI